MNGKQKLNIGILIVDPNIPNWMYEILKNIDASDHSKIVIVIQKSSITSSKTSFLSRLWKKSSTLLFVLFTKLEQKIFKASPDAFQIKNIRDIIDCHILQLSDGTIQNDDLAIIKSHKCDVILDFAFGNPPNELLNIPKFGIWEFLHSDTKTNNGGPEGVWELFENRFESGVTLKANSQDFETPMILHKSYYSNDELSVLRNKNNYFWKSNTVIFRTLEELYLLGEDIFFNRKKKLNADHTAFSGKAYTIPTNFEVLRSLSKIYWKGIKRVINRKSYFEQWILLFKIQKNESIGYAFKDFKRLLPPKDRFWADPFVIFKNDLYYIFIEELIYSEDKGKIAVIVMDMDGSYSEPKLVLETAYHLSYPFLIEDGDELYMLPETKGNQTIELYQCVEFPLKWELKKILFSDIEAQDSTIFKHEDKFWLFTNVVKINGVRTTGHELYIFYSESLLNDQWMSHPQNPVVIDHSFSRPAGKIFKADGKIFRPAQNCSKHYGYGMRIMEIIKLNEKEFGEQHVRFIDPDWDKDLLSTHTLNRMHHLTVIDAKINRKL